MSDRVETECQHCGQVDDHPKAHVGELGTGDVVTKHHDCLSAREKQLLVESGQVAGSVKASAIIRECEGGLRGDALLGFIQGGATKKDLATGKRTEEDQ